MLCIGARIPAVRVLSGSRWPGIGIQLLLRFFGEKGQRRRQQVIPSHARARDTRVRDLLREIIRCTNKRIGVDAEPGHPAGVDVHIIRDGKWCDVRDIFQPLREQTDHPVALFHVGTDDLELRQCDRSRALRHAVGEPGHDVLPSEPLEHLAAAAVADETHAFGQVIVVGHHTAANIRTHGFLRVEGESARIGERPGQPSLVFPEDGLADVFIEKETVFAGEFDNGVHIANRTGHVHNQNRTCAVCYTGFNRVRAADHGTGVRVRENGDVALPDNTLHGAVVRR